MKEDKSKIGRLDALSLQLNTISDKLNEAFTALEKKLAAMKVGVTCWLDVPLEAGEPYCLSEDEGGYDSNVFRYKDVYQLGYCKCRDEWHICIRKSCWQEVSSGYSTTGKDWEQGTLLEGPVPITQAPRSVRVEAAAFLEKLVDELIEKTEHYLANIEKAQGLIEKL